MTDVLSPYDLYSIAREFEANGVVFYRNAAKSVKDVNCARMLLELAETEKGHELLITQLQEALTEDEKRPAAFSPSDTRANLFLGIAANNVFDFTVAAEFFHTPGLTVQDILKKAIALEKDSVIFYLGFRDIVRDSTSQERLDALINQEMSHIHMLNEYLSVL